MGGQSFFCGEKIFFMEKKALSVEKQQTFCGEKDFFVEKKRI